MLEELLFNIEDHRRKQGQRYKLGHILLFSIFAILCDANSYRKVHSFIQSHYKILDNLYHLNWKKIPAYTTLRNIIQGVDSAEIEKYFREHSLCLSNQNSHKRYIAFDGKTVRGSFDNFQDKKAIQVFSAFFTDNNIIIAHEEIEEKTNEIPTAQKLIKALGLSDYVLTLDAMHCQTKTLDAAVNTNNHVIVQVKENQKTLLSSCTNISETNSPIDVYQEPVNKQRNRIESRKVAVYDNKIGGILDDNDNNKWALVQSIIKVERERQIFDTKIKEYKSSDEISYYISTAQLSAEQFCQAIRLHWGIENKNHYVRDVSMNEDNSRIRVNPQNFAKLRSFALNIMRANAKTNIQLELFENCMNFSQILNYVGIK
jgi:predicted transposase YbfD/YdcC